MDAVFLFIQPPGLPLTARTSLISWTEAWQLHQSVPSGLWGASLVGLCMFRFLMWSQTWFSLTVGRTLFLALCSICSRSVGREVASDRKSCWEPQAFSLSVGTGLPVVSIGRDILSWSFLSWLAYLEKPFLLFFVSHPKFSSRHVLTFLTPSLLNQAVSLYSSQDPCPCFHCLSSSLFPFSLTRRSQLSCATLAFYAWFLTLGDQELSCSMESTLKDLPALFCSFVPEGCFPGGPTD